MNNLLNVKGNEATPFYLKFIFQILLATLFITNTALAQTELPTNEAKTKETSERISNNDSNTEKATITDAQTQQTTQSEQPKEKMSKEELLDEVRPLNKDFNPEQGKNSNLNKDYVFKLVGGMFLVILILFVLLGLLKKVGFNPGKRLNGFYTVLSVNSLGPKEKICLVEVGDTWLILGITPHHISTLHTLPKDSLELGGGRKLTSDNFSKMLERFRKPSG